MQVGSSRTVLHERFTLLIGRPPMRYLVGWRMQLAAERLATTDDAIARIAAGVATNQKRRSTAHFGA